MKRLIAICALLVACSSGLDDPTLNNDSGNKTDLSSDAGDSNSVLIAPINVMTWNVQRYFDTVCDSGFCDDGDFEGLVSDSEFSFRATQIADAVRDERPDIILFQELEKEICLDEIAEKLEMNGTAFGETFFNGSLDVGVLTRGDVQLVVTHRDDTPLPVPGGTETFSREFLEVHIEIDGRQVIVFSAHFKSKRNDDPDRREAEATGARAIVVAVAEQNPNALIVLGGDMNDTPGSVPIDNLIEGGDITLVSSDETWTVSFNGETQAIDHLLFVETENIHLVPDSVRAVRDSSGRGLSISDHAAVIATFGFIE